MRFNLRRGGSEGIDQLERVADRVNALVGWHVELYVNGPDLPELEARLLKLRRVSIDHLGMCRDSLPTLLRLVERGVKVKATGFGRLEFDARVVLPAIADLDPSALLFGTDLTSTRARRPFSNEHLTLLYEALGPSLAARALHDNAVAWYQPGPNVTR